MKPTSLSQRPDFQTLVDHLDDTAIWVVTNPGSFEYISAGFEDIWGIPVDEVLDDPDRLIDTFHPADRERVRSIIEASEQRVSEESYTARIVRPDGTVRWLKTRQVPLRESDGTLSTIVGISTDVTEVTRREQELQALNRVIRHDIRNDMTVILAWAELLEDHVDAEGEAHLEKIVTAGDHIVELTEIARDYVETLAGTGQVERTPISLRSTLTTEVELRRETYPDAEFELNCEIPAVEVLANEMLSSVFRNLLNNAVQHNHAETPRIEITCERDDETVTVSIADNGPGIPDSLQDSLFTKGGKGIESSGSGIGLYLVHSLVTQYGGSVWLEETDATGAVFAVQLPIAR